MYAGSRASKGSAKKRPSEADLANGAVRAKKKRKRKPKLPKNFDPENPGPKPDPERWLPKWQRSDFKKKRNRRREKASLCYQLILRSLLSFSSSSSSSVPIGSNASSDVMTKQMPGMQLPVCCIMHVWFRTSFPPQLLTLIPTS